MRTHCLQKRNMWKMSLSKQFGCVIDIVPETILSGCLGCFTYQSVFKQTVILCSHYAPRSPSINARLNSPENVTVSKKPVSL